MSNVGYCNNCEFVIEKPDDKVFVIINNKCPKCESKDITVYELERVK